MSTHTSMGQGDIETRGQMRSVAPAWHTIVLILLICAPLIQTVIAEDSQLGQAVRTPDAVQLYIIGAVVQIVFFLFAWWGIRLRKLSIQSVTGRAWTSWRELLRDAGFALLFWGAWYGVLLAFKIGLAKAGIQNTGASGMVYPHGALEIALWIPNAALAGFIEEFVFRGYLMRQFASWTRSTAAGLLLQALLFGVAHAYLLGTRQIILITASGILVGLFVLWRGNLRSAMVFHAWADIFGAAIVRGLPFQ